MSGTEERAFASLVRLPHALAGVGENSPVLLGFSGGADSSALLHWLAGESRRIGFPLILAHLDHGIRGAEAERDRRFCEEIAREYGLEICIGYADVPARAASRGESLEEAARDERYAFFAQIMRAREIPLLATAHHADDHLETVLFRLSRGTGAHGLCGISPARRFGNGWLTRPLLSLTRAEIEDYCAKQGIRYVTDSTNADGSYARNRIRAEVLPVLESLFPGAAQRSLHLSEQLREDGEYLDTLAKDLVARHATDDTFPIPPLMSSPIPVRRRALGLWTRARCGRVLSVHEAALWRLLTDATPHMEVALPGELVCTKEKDCLVIGDALSRETVCLHLPLCEGMQKIPGTDACAEVMRIGEGIKIHNSSMSPYIILKSDFDIIKSGLYWRVREDGDVIRLRGMHRKLRRLQAEAKIPARLRARLPLLCDREGVLWAPGIGARDGTESEESGLLIRLIRDDE